VAAALVVTLVGMVAPSSSMAFAVADGGAPAAQAGPLTRDDDGGNPPGQASPAAPGDVTWGLAPADGKLGTGRSNYAYQVDPGASLKDAIVITNHSATPLALRVYATDALTTSEGRLDLLPADQPAKDLGSWIALKEPTVEIAPNDSAKVSFTLTVPADAAPGDHAGGIITSIAGEAGAGTVALDRRLALRVMTRVAGTLTPSLAVRDLTVTDKGTFNPVGTTRATIRYTLVNTGNARIVPTEQASVTGPFGWAKISDDAAVLEEILPGSSVQREIEVAGVRPLVRANAAVTVNAEAVGVGGAGATAQAAGEAATWAVPWTLLGIIVLVVLLAIILTRGRGAAPRPPR
jgi:hypothetical protein